MRSRPYDPYVQSAAMPYRWRGGRLEVLLITSSSGRRWVVPKGIVEPDLTPAASAAKEALEEAGVEGALTPEPLGSYEYAKWGGTCRVEVFPLAVKRVHETWEEDHRRRQWLSVDRGADLVDEPALARLLVRLPDVVPRTD